jgi:hypothetical protein
LARSLSAKKIQKEKEFIGEAGNDFTSQPMRTKPFLARIGSMKKIQKEKESSVEEPTESRKFYDVELGGDARMSKLLDKLAVTEKHPRDVSSGMSGENRETTSLDDYTTSKQPKRSLRKALSMKSLGMLGKKDSN